MITGLFFRLEDGFPGLAIQQATCCLTAVAVGKIMAVSVRGKPDLFH